MWLRSSLFVFLAVGCYGQTAITELTSFWEGNVSATDRIMWDSKGNAHGVYVGASNFREDTTMFGSGWYRAAGTTTPYNSGAMTVPGATVDTGTGSFAYCIWVRPSSAYADSYLGRWSTTTATRSWQMAFNAMPGRPQLTYAMTNGTTAVLLPASPTVSAGALTLSCMHYNSSTGELGISGNGNAWTKVTPAAPFQTIPPGNACGVAAGIYDPYWPCTLDFSHVRQQFFPAGEPKIGRTMFWNGYIPTDAELSAIYNGGSGRDAAYFGLSFTPPTRPLSVTLQNSTFADDANLTGQQGLYWLRPYPLKFYSPALAAANGDYVWFRSTDHSLSGGGIWMGFSSSPEVLPSSWTQILTDAALSAADPGYTWEQLETPMLVWNPDTSLFHMYGHAGRANSGSPYVQATHVWTSPDLSTWTWRGVALTTDTAACPGNPCYHHTGYANIIRNGTGDWEAQSLVTANELSGTDRFIRFGIWTSTDGLTWTFDRETTFQTPIVPYRNQQNQRIATPVGLRTGDVSIASNYVGVALNNFEFGNPVWPLFDHDGDGVYNGVQGNWLQDVRAYEENGTVWLYAKWSFREPSTVRLYKGTLSTATTGLVTRDRRSYGAMFIGDGSQTASNPRRYNISGSPDFLGAGFETAKAAMLTKVGNLLNNADAYSPRPQAIIVWDLEGQEFQHIFSYVGAPNLLSVVSPEMDSMADDIMALIRSRGYEPGLTLRPHRIRSGSGRPTNACWSQGSNDGWVYIDTAAAWPNRGYRCGPGVVTFPSGSTVQTSGEFVVSYQSGSSVRFVTTGTLPSPLVVGTEYWMCSWDNEAQTFAVATDSGCSSVISSYSGGSGTHTMMSWRGPVNIPVQELPADLNDALTHLRAKIDYARTRWGVKHFYVDSTYYCATATCQTNTVLPNEGFWQTLHEEYPDTVFMPENSPSGIYTRRYVSFNNGDYKPASNPLTIHIQDRSPGYSDWRDEIRQEILKGTTYMVTLNTAATGGNANDLYRQDLLWAREQVRTITMTDRGQARTFRSDPGAAFRYPLVSRVYFAASPEGLAASTTYCERREIDRCYLSSTLQESSTLDLSSRPYYQIRYYDYAGGLVSNPGLHATIQ